MNSIDQFSPLKIGTLNTDTQDLSDMISSDPIALETLRAMMGGIVPEQLGLQPTITASCEVVKTPKDILAIFTKALAEGNLPPSVTTLIQSLSKSLTAQPNVADSALSSLRAALGQTALTDKVVPSSINVSPEVIAEMKQLLTEISGVSIDSTPTLQEIQTTLVKALANTSDQPTAQAKLIEQQPNQTKFIEQEPNQASLGQSILQSLNTQSSAAASVSQASPVNGTPTVERVEQVSALMTEMADRVLVTDPIHGQTTEVRVKLAENIMPGTEVRVWRENGGELRVSFDTSSSYWARVLNDASPMLAQRLNDRLNMDILPQVTVQQQGGQPEDGRSRNRQNPWTVAQEDTEA